eukprot:jgi/Tetstr1/445977/TSEL_003534.t1
MPSRPVAVTMQHAGGAIDPVGGRAASLPRRHSSGAPRSAALARRPTSSCALFGREADSCPAILRSYGGECQPHAPFEQRSDDWCLLPLQDVSRPRGQHLAALVARNQRLKGRGKYLWHMMDRAGTARAFRTAKDFHHFTIHQGNALGLHMAGNGSAAAFKGVDIPDADIQHQLDFSTCAVVGSSEILLQRQYGAQISSHSVIIRFNNAPTKGFEGHVGNRTDIRITNAGFSFFSEAGDRETCLIRPRTGFFESDKRTAEYLTSREMVKNSCRRVMISPQYEAYRRGLWGHMVGGTYPNWSSGFMGVALALNLCGRVSIYGFSWDTSYYFAKVHLSRSKRAAALKQAPHRGKARAVLSAPAADGDAAPGQPTGASDTHQWSLEEKCVRRFGLRHPCVALRT